MARHSQAYVEGGIYTVWLSLRRLCTFFRETLNTQGHVCIVYYQSESNVSTYRSQATLKGGGAIPPHNKQRVNHSEARLALCNPSPFKVAFLRTFIA